jgi:putative ABC transport system substrate-binding protein
MRRRDIIKLSGGALAWPFAAHAQQPMPLIGFLSGVSAGPFAHLVTAFRQGLEETGHVDGRNVQIEYRWAEAHSDRLPALAAELVRRRVQVLVASGGSNTIQAAHAATKTIPIVFVGGTDPVRLGLVRSLNQPGGNATGVYQLTTALESKRLGLLRELVPTATTVAVLLHQANPIVETQFKDVQEAARAGRQQVHFIRVGSEQELDKAFAAAAQFRAEALLVTGDANFNSWRAEIVALAARHRIPAIYEQREYAAAGGLASYGTRLVDAYRQGGIYAGRVLKGEKPAELPVFQAIRFEFVINLHTAKALGLTVPPMLLARADEVIE